ncbi:hypothetical protein MCUN1_001442 [Malassezia cuniculi]|uniref:RRM domain-containing protein n=1 Tax=Malassezia cuniculi TaxID=948313 RepID=A0AAF0EUI9_9BASI|nr:hypothetical protein MCUN1_001442 [Malassezia cuniculi]
MDRETQQFFSGIDAAMRRGMWKDDDVSEEDPYRYMSRKRTLYSDEPEGEKRSRGDDDDGYGRRRRDRMRRARSPPPEGTIRLTQRPRRITLWDITAPGFEETDALSAKATGLFGASANELNNTSVPPGYQLPATRAEAFADATTANALCNAALYRHARCLQIDSVAPETTSQGLRQFINTRMIERKLNVSGSLEPCRGADIDADKHSAWLEFREADGATSALFLDGIVYLGHTLRIHRPRDPPQVVTATTGVDPFVEDGPDKLYIGAIPLFLGEMQVTELLKAFGELKGFRLMRDPVTGDSEGYAFCNYRDPAATELAIEGLNGMEVGEQRLIVQRASESPIARTQREGPETSEEPTCAMTMLNMVTPEELKDDQEYEEILEDVREECAKYGRVRDVRIPRPGEKSSSRAAQEWAEAAAAAAAAGGKALAVERDGVGRVYVLFSHVSECTRALRAIAGRQFDGRMVICAFLRENAWPRGEDGSGEYDEV